MNKKKQFDHQIISHNKEYRMESTPPSQQLLQEALMRIGRNLMLYQEIELRLKKLLPVLHPDGGASGLEGLKNFQSLIAEKTLGQILGEWKKSRSAKFNNEVENNLNQYLRMMNDDRNELAHSLLKLPDMSWSDETGCKNIISYLDSKLNRITSVLELLEIIRQIIASSFQDAEFDENGLLKNEIKSRSSIHIKFEGA